MTRKQILPKEDKMIERMWYIVDASGIRLGKLASLIARYLQGKRKSQYKPNVDTGDYVIVVNSKRVDVNPGRVHMKKYRRHSGYPGGLKETTYAELQRKHPNEIIERAVKGMMPRTKLGKKMLKKLFVYEMSEHPHEAQKLKLIEL